MRYHDSHRVLEVLLIEHKLQVKASISWIALTLSGQTRDRVASEGNDGHRDGGRPDERCCSVSMDGEGGGEGRKR
jgi:hypothetical protein